MRIAKILFLGPKKLVFSLQRGGGGGAANAQPRQCLRKFRLQSKQYSQPPDLGPGPPLQFPSIAQMMLKGSDLRLRDHRKCKSVEAPP